MKKQLAALLILCFFTVFNVQAQTALKKAMNTMHVSMNLPEFFDISQNEDGIYVTPITEESPVPEIAQSYGSEPASGATAFKVMFGHVHSIIRHRNEEYAIFVYAGGEAEIRYGNLIKNNSHLFNVINPSFNRIKHDLRYGIRHKSATAEEIAALDTMIAHYPKEKAQELFNADWMASYPMDLRGEIYEDKYSQCQVVVIAKNGLGIYFYFMMTDKSAKNFDDHLRDLEKVFWFTEMLSIDI
jgi:hypothetical protein